MKDEFPKIYKKKIDNIKSKVQDEFYYHADNEMRTNTPVNEKVDKLTLMKKINNIFTSTDYVYQADIIIMYKNGENKRKKVIGTKDNYLLTIEGEKIAIDDIYDIK